MDSLSITIFVAFLTTLSIVSNITPTLAIQRLNSAPTYTNFIKSSCKTTRYPELCYHSLSTHASAIQTSPKMLATTAFSVTLTTTRTTTEKITQMSNGPGIKPREASAISDCLEMLHDAISELQESMKEFNQIKGKEKIGLKMNDIQTWVSAAMTDEDTCMEGFGEKAMDGKVKSVIRGKIVNISHLTSNLLSLIAVMG